MNLQNVAATDQFNLVLGTWSISVIDYGFPGMKIKERNIPGPKPGAE